MTVGRRANSCTSRPDRSEADCTSAMLRLACPAWEIRWLAHAGLRHDHLRRDDARWPPHRRGQPRARASPTPTGRRRCSRRPIAAISDGRNQYPPGPGRPGAADGDRRAPAALLRPRRRPRPRGPGHRGCHRGDRGGDPGPVEPATRSSPSSRFYDSYAATIALAGAVARAPSPLRAPDFALRPGRAAARAFTPRTRLVLLNTPHNPTGKVFTRAELELDRRRCREHDACRRHRRGLRAPRLRRRRHVPRRHPARHARSAPSRSPRPARPSPSPGGRSAGSAARPRWSRPRGRSSSSSPTWRSGPFQPAVAAGPRPRRTTCTPGSRRPAGQARPALRGAAPPASGVPARRAPTSSSPTPRRSGSPTRWTFCRRLP